MVQTTERKIESIAIYLRKSREDEDTEDTLAKHRTELLEFVKRNNWTKYKIYEEIGSGGTIGQRPIFTELLERVEEGLYDAVVVRAVDRLTRGSMKEAGIIFDVFKYSNTLIITPEKTVDLDTRSGQMMTEIESFVSRQEYQLIKDRLKGGKVNGAKRGEWTNGKPMFPYLYDRNTGQIIINEKGKDLYRSIVDMYLKENMSTESISDTLNKNSVSTITGRGKWRQSQILKMLSSGIHAGYVYYGKRRRTYTNRVLLNAPDKVVFIKGTHEAIVSESEWIAIQKRIEDNRKVPLGARNSTYTLSGLVKCGKCGQGMKVVTQQNKQYIRKCVKTLPDGFSRCDNSGIPEKRMIEYLDDHMSKHHVNLYEDNETDEINTIKIEFDITVLKESIQSSIKKNERIKELYFDGDIDKPEYNKRRLDEEDKLMKLQEQLTNLLKSPEIISEENKEQRKQNWISHFSIGFLSSDEYTIKEKNQNAHLLIDKVIYLREGNDINVEILYR